MRPRLLLPPLLWAAAIFLVSSMPNPPSGGGDELRAVAAHAGEYAVLAFLLARALAGHRGLSPVVVAAAAIVIAVAYGVSDEWHQSFVPNRDADAFDVIFDAAGAVLGAGAWALLNLRQTRLSARSA